MRPALSMSTFKEIASVGEDALLHTAMLLGLKGDRSNLTVLLRAAIEDGPGPLMLNVDPMALQFRLMEQDVASIFNALLLGNEPPQMHACLRLVEGVTFQSAVASAIGRDTHNPVKVACVDDLARWAALSELPTGSLHRTPWQDDHGALLAAAIEVWTPKQPGHHAWHLHSLLRLSIRAVNHPGVVQTFIDAGLSERDLWPEPLFHDDWVNHPFIDAVLNRNFEGAGLLLESVKKPEAIVTFGQMVLQISHITHDKKAPWSLTGKAMATETADQLEKRDPTRPVAEEVLALLDNMHAKLNDPVAMAMRSGILASYLVGCDKLECRGDAATIDHLLHGAPDDRPSLSACLSDWPERRFDLNHVDRLSGNVQKLMVTALQLHVPQVVEAGLPMISTGATDPLVFGTKERALQHVCGAHSVGLDTADLGRCLDLLYRVGYPVKEAFDIEAQTIDASARWRTSVLDLMAGHNHEDQVAAMVTALEFGCPSQLKNHRGRTPATAMANTERRAQWEGIHRSFLSARAAHDALSEIGVIEPHPLGKGP